MDPTQNGVRCSFVISPGVVCRRVAAPNSEVCEEHLQALEEARERRERAAEELRARLSRPAPTEEVMARLDDIARRKRLADERRVANERTQRWMADRAEEKRAGADSSARLSARRLQEQRRLEAIIARRRWKQKAAWRKRGDGPSS
jgi:hypothetical protein